MPTGSKATAGTSDCRLASSRRLSDRHHLKLGRADLGAMGEAEEDEHIAPAEVGVGDGLAVGAHQREGSADKRRARRLHGLAAMRGGDKQDCCAGQSADEETPDDERDQAGSHLLSELQQRAVDSRALQEPAEGEIADSQPTFSR